MADRGIKKWNAYRALIEQMPSLNETVEGTKKVDKPIISEDEAEEINTLLTNYHGERLKVKYFRNAGIFEEIIRISKIDIYEKKLVLDNRKSIKLSEIFYLKKID